MDGWGDTNQDSSFHKNIFELAKVIVYKSYGELLLIFPVSDIQILKRLENILKSFRKMKV